MRNYWIPAEVYPVDSRFAGMTHGAGMTKLNKKANPDKSARDLCITPTFAQFWSLRGAKRRGNLVAYQCVMRLLSAVVAIGYYGEVCSLRSQ